MDDQQTYLLNGLLSRQFGLGRIVRFRPVERGRQAQAFELFTAQEREYLAQLYPGSFPAQHLDLVARTVNTMDENRFSVVPFIRSKGNTFASEGPQNSRLMVSLCRRARHWPQWTSRNTTFRRSACGWPGCIGCSRNSWPLRINSRWRTI